MKKTFISFFLALVAAVTVNAQQISVVASNGNTNQL